MKKTLLLYILLLFAVVPAYSQALLDGIAADVNGEIILITDVNLYASNIAIQSKIDPRENPEKYEQMKKYALERIIEKKVLLAKAEEDSITVPEDQVNSMLDSRIRNFVAQLGSETKLEEEFGMSIRQIRKYYFDQIREELTIQQLQQHIISQVKITRTEVERFFATYKDSLPEIPDQMEISHLIMKVKPNEAQARKARAKIDSLKRILDSGGDFEKLARKNSEDPGSAPRGGNLGFFSKGDLAEEFEKAAIALEPGEISDVVQTQFGYHIIQLLEKKGNRFNTRHILVQLQPSAADEDSTLARLKEVRRRALAGEEFASLALQYSDDPSVAQNKGNIGTFSRNDQNLPEEYKKVLKNMKEGDISEPFKTDFGYTILYMRKLKPKHRLTLENDWLIIEQMALKEKQQKTFSDYLNKARKEVYIDIKLPGYKKEGE